MTGPIESPRFCAVRHAAKVLGVSRMTIYRLIEDGQFPAVRIRSRLVVPIAVLDQLEEEAIQRFTERPPAAANEPT